MNINLEEVIPAIRSGIQDIAANTALREPANFDGRADAIDFIDFHIIDRIDGLCLEKIPQKELEHLRQQASQVKGMLEQTDTILFARLKKHIKTGMYRESFREMTGEHMHCYKADANSNTYDNLDMFINGLLSDEPVPTPALTQAPEMVFYQKTPARIVFEMAKRAQLQQSDVFFDIGSGLGQATILMNLLSGIKAVGVEYEPAYCNYAIRCASKLHLPNVNFINANALEADYTAATVFFMYTPFAGNMLQDMLAILKNESRKRPIRIFTYGPCSAMVAQQTWLDCAERLANNAYHLYEFKSADISTS